MLPASHQLSKFRTRDPIPGTDTQNPAPRTYKFHQSQIPRSSFLIHSRTPITTHNCNPTTQEPTTETEHARPNLPIQRSSHKFTSPSPGTTTMAFNLQTSVMEGDPQQRPKLEWRRPRATTRTMRVWKARPQPQLRKSPSTPSLQQTIDCSRNLKQADSCACE